MHKEEGNQMLNLTINSFEISAQCYLWGANYMLGMESRVSPPPALILYNSPLSRVDVLTSSYSLREVK